MVRVVLRVVSEDCQSVSFWRRSLFFYRILFFGACDIVGCVWRRSAHALFVNHNGDLRLIACGSLY